MSVSAGGKVVVEQWEDEVGYLSVRVPGVNLGAVVRGELKQSYELEPGESVELEQHCHIFPGRRWTLFVSNEGGRAVVRQGGYLP